MVGEEEENPESRVENELAWIRGASRPDVPPPVAPFGAHRSKETEIRVANEPVVGPEIILLVGSSRGLRAVAWGHAF